MEKPGKIASFAKGVDNKISDVYRNVALGKARKAAAERSKNFSDYINKQNRGTNLQDALGQQESRWSEKKTSEKALAPINVEKIVFENIIFDGTPAEKDRAKRQSEKSLSLAQKMTKELEKIAYNTKVRNKQDTKIKKQGDFLGKAIVKSKSFASKLKEIGKNFWEKFLDFFYNLQGIKMLLGPLSFLGAISIAGIKTLKSLIFSPVKFIKTVIGKTVDLAKQGLKALTAGGKSIINGFQQALVNFATKYSKIAALLRAGSVAGIIGLGVYFVAAGFGVTHEEWEKAGKYIYEDFLKPGWEWIKNTGKAGWKWLGEAYDTLKNKWSDFKEWLAPAINKGKEFFQAISDGKTTEWVVTNLLKATGRGLFSLSNWIGDAVISSGGFLEKIGAWVEVKIWEPIKAKIIDPLGRGYNSMLEWLANSWLATDGMAKTLRSWKISGIPTATEAKNLKKTRDQRLKEKYAAIDEKTTKRKFKNKKDFENYVKLLDEGAEKIGKFSQKLTDYAIQKGKLVLQGVEEMGIGLVKILSETKAGRKTLKQIIKVGKASLPVLRFIVNYVPLSGFQEIKRLASQSIKKFGSNVYNNTFLKDVFPSDKSLKESINSNIEITKQTISSSNNNFISKNTNMSGGKIPENAKEFIKLLDKLETGGSNRKYDTVNRKSGAFGRYQFMPRTWNDVAPRAGIYFTMSKQKALSGILPSASQQDAAYEVFFNDLIKSLKKQGVKPTLLNLWIAHNLGPACPKFMVGKTNTPPISASKMLRNINANLPKQLRSGTLFTARTNYMNHYSQKIAKITGNTTWLNSVSTGVTDTLGDIASSAMNGIKSIVNNAYLAYFGLSSFSSNSNDTETYGSTSNLQGPSGSKTKGLTPCTKQFLKEFTEFAKQRGVSVKMVEGFRTAEYQNKLYQKGRTTGGSIVTYKDGYKKKSKHQSGQAMDIISAKGYSDKAGNQMVGQLMREFASLNSNRFKTRFLGAWDWNHVEVLGCSMMANQTTEMSPIIATDNAAINTSSNSMFIPGVGMIPNGGSALQALQQQNIQMMDQINNVSNSINQKTETQDAELFGQIPVTF